MKQLGGMDATFLNMEIGSIYGHVSSMTIFEPRRAPAGRDWRSPSGRSCRASTSSSRTVVGS